FSVCCCSSRPSSIPCASFLLSPAFLSFHPPSPTDISTLSLHDALPIFIARRGLVSPALGILDACSILRNLRLLVVTGFGVCHKKTPPGSCKIVGEARSQFASALNALLGDPSAPRLHFVFAVVAVSYLGPHVVVVLVALREPRLVRPADDRIAVAVRVPPRHCILRRPVHESSGCEHRAEVARVLANPSGVEFHPLVSHHYVIDELAAGIDGRFIDHARKRVADEDESILNLGQHTVRIIGVTLFNGTDLSLKVLDALVTDLIAPAPNSVLKVLDSIFRPVELLALDLAVWGHDRVIPVHQGLAELSRLPGGCVSA